VTYNYVTVFLRSSANKILTVETTFLLAYINDVFFKRITCYLGSICWFQSFSELRKSKYSEASSHSHYQRITLLHKEKTLLVDSIRVLLALCVGLTEWWTLKMASQKLEEGNLFPFSISFSLSLSLSLSLPSFCLFPSFFRAECVCWLRGSTVNKFVMFQGK
jgi:hypothetical protein